MTTTRSSVFACGPWIFSVFVCLKTYNAIKPHCFRNNLKKMKDKNFIFATKENAVRVTSAGAPERSACERSSGAGTVFVWLSD